MNENIYHILPSGSFWQTEEAGTKRIVLRGPIKRDLVIQTVQKVRRNSLSRIVIHKEDGTIEEQRLIKPNTENFINTTKKVIYNN
jgi:hypothetical protein